MRSAAPLLVLASLLLLPAVAAQAPPPGGYRPTLLTIHEPDVLLDPLGGTATVPLEVRVDCTLARSDTPLNFTVRDQPSWFWVRTMPGWRTETNDYSGYANLPCDDRGPAENPCIDPCYVVIREPMVVNVTTSAPAYRFANFTVQVTRSGAVATDHGALQVGYFGRVQMVKPDRIVRVDPSVERVDVPFRVQNLGNGETTITFSYEASVSGVRLDGPDAMKIGSSQQGGSWDRPIVVRVYLQEARDDFTVTVKAQGASSNVSDPKSAGVSSAEGTIDIQRQVPGAGLLLATGAVAAAVLALRRRGHP